MTTISPDRPPGIGRTPASSALRDHELRELARDDALRAHRADPDWAASAWLAMLVLTSGFLAAVGVGAVLDAFGIAF